jgi:type I restriction enzyme M protein
MTKYVTKPFEYLDNTIGVEINFNKVFYTPEKLREVSTINADLEALENDLNNLEKDLAL